MYVCVCPELCRVLEFLMLCILMGYAPEFFQAMFCCVLTQTILFLVCSRTICVHALHAFSLSKYI